MKGFRVSFNVYADSQQEADLVSEAFKAFVSEQAQRGVAVTANKLAEAIRRYKNNYFVTTYFE